MSIETHLVELFTQDEDIADVIGAGSAARVYMMEIPEGKPYPALVITNISAPRENTLRGPTGYVHSRIEIDCWGNNLTELKNLENGLAVLVRRRLARYKGRMGGCSIRSCILDSSRDFNEPEMRAKRTSMDYMIWHTEE